MMIRFRPSLHASRNMRKFQLLCPRPLSRLFHSYPPPAVQPPPVQYTPTTDKDLSQDDISFALNNNNTFFIMAVINSEECELDRGICLSFYTPATAMSNILKLKKKLRQCPNMLSTLRTVHINITYPRDILSCDAKLPSGYTMLNQCLAITEWSVELEPDFITQPMRGIVLLNPAAEKKLVPRERSLQVANAKHLVKNKFRLERRKSSTLRQAPTSSQGEWWTLCFISPASSIN